MQAQILVAEGYALDSEEIHIKSQEDVTCNGYSIQTRVTSEDPANNFLPDTGEMTVYRSGSGNGTVWTVAVHMSEPLYHHTMTVCL